MNTSRHLEQNDLNGAGSWLKIAALLADLAFETDTEGRFTAFGPGKVLGFAPSAMLGTRLGELLGAEPAFGLVVRGICRDCVAWQGTVALRRSDNVAQNYHLALAPRISRAGGVIGLYGLCSAFATDDSAPSLSRNAGMLDAETAFWSAAQFHMESERRFDRLDVEGVPGTLLLLGFGQAPVALRPAIAMRLADELRDVVRPTDLLGRVDATTIALWCDGMDHLTGGERAARFCERLPPVLPGGQIISVGVAVRWPGSGDDMAALIGRAGDALRLAGLATYETDEGQPRGAWRVSP